MAGRIKGRNRINFRYNISTYLEFLKKYKISFFAILFVIFIFYLASIVDNFLFKVIIDEGTRYVNKEIDLPKYLDILLMVAFAYLAALLVRVLGSWVEMHLVSRLEAGMMLDLKKKFFNHLVHLAHRFHSNNKTGAMISKLVRGSSAVERIDDVVFFNFIPVISTIIVTGASLIYFDVVSAIIVLSVLVCFLLYTFYINNRQEQSGLEANDAEDLEKANISDVFTNIEAVKYFGKENEIKSRFARLSENAREAIVRNWDYFRWLNSGQYFILGIGTFILIYVSLTKFFAGSLTLGTLVFIYTVYNDAFDRFFDFVHGIRAFYKAMADFESLFRYAKIKNEIKDMPNARALKIRHGIIEFRNVSFSYKRKKVLQNFSLKIKRGQKVAIIGPSGAGKSTIIKLLFRLYDVDSGEILIDGRNINNFKQESLRAEISIVPQECILFDDTIYNNIKFSNPPAAREEVFNSIKYAQLDKVIARLPNKERTVVGERGIKLSGGEKQRVSIARAILDNKKVLVLDEATSSLDSATEHEIQNALIKLIDDKTAIMIAHRLSTISNADLIVVLDKGRIVQTGTHQELMMQRGPYKKLWELQKGSQMIR